MRNSRALAQSLIALVVGCAPAAHVRRERPQHPKPESAQYWRWVSTPEVLARYVRVPDDALGVYLRRAGCEECFDTIKGPKFDELCGQACSIPFEPRKAQSTVFYVGADRRPVVVPATEILAIAKQLEAQRGMTDPDVLTLRHAVQLGFQSDGWIGPIHGTTMFFDSFPPELRVDAGVEPEVDGEPAGALPVGKVLSAWTVRQRLEANNLTPAERAVQAAMGVLDRRISPHAITIRQLAAGFLITFTDANECHRGEMQVVVDDNNTAHEAFFEARGHGCHPRGRTPAGLESVAACAAPGLARFLADAHHLEAASVTAFERLADELSALGAPAALVRRARAAAADEVRHAQLMASLGAATSPVVVAPSTRRSLESIAIENAVEGCVREAFAAVICELQAQRASDATIRGAMREVADDEHAHADLAHDVAAWFERQLASRDRLDAAVAHALAELSDPGEPYDGVRAELGLPTQEEFRRLAAGFARSHYSSSATARTRCGRSRS